MHGHAPRRAGQRPSVPVPGSARHVAGRPAAVTAHRPGSGQPPAAAHGAALPGRAAGGRLRARRGRSAVEPRHAWLDRKSVL
ncbi:hypothetical protein G6F51_014741 [Rhizopus arrhizus]|uniref:Uncharacterized protein n=1 Tax=Rhizopus oryzae TaxID=64495 RepID=A0A9P7BY85_RHIOR|nr:hypothetical protein G6F51_014741 [Rhizopus arrhizus]